MTPGPHPIAHPIAHPILGPGFVLASQSASRKAMLAAAGLQFEAVAADIDERAIEREMNGAPADEVAQALATAKAMAVSAQHADRLVLGSDSLVEVAGRRFDKPADRAQAAEHLRFFAGKAMHLHSAASLTRGNRVLWVGHDRAVLHVRIFDDAFIEAYLDAEWPAIAACAGGFRIEARGVHLFDRIIGDRFTILGMPLLHVLEALRTVDGGVQADQA